MADFYETLQRLSWSPEEKRRLAWQYETGQPEERKLLEAHVWAEHEKEFGVLPYEPSVVLPVPPLEVSEGANSWGATQTIVGGESQGSFGIDDAELLQHTVVVGRSGAGKTNTLMGLVRAVRSRQARPPVWILDWKGSWRELLDEPRSKKLLLFTIGRDVSPLPFNPLRPPPGIRLDVWMNQLIDVFAHAYFEGHGATSMLQRGLQAAYRLYGIKENGDHARWPTLFDVQSCLEGIRTNQREILWLTSLRRALQRLTFGDFGKALCASRPVSLADLLTKDVILELGSLSDPDRAFFCGALLLWLYQYLLRNEGKREILKLLLVFEESHFLFSREKERMGETIIERLPRMVRELGAGLVLADQQPHLMSTQALANTYCRIAMNLAHEYDLRAIGAAMGLDQNTRKGLGHLPIGYGVVKLQDRYTWPFLVRFPLLSVRKGSVTDAMVEAHMKSFYESQPRAAEPGPECNRKAATNVKASPPVKKRTDSPRARLLADLFGFPLSSHTQRWQRLGLTAYEGSRSIKGLQRAALAQVVEIPTRRGRVKIAYPSRKAMEEHWPSKPRSRRKGGGEHACWAWFFERRFRKAGYSFEANVPVGGGREIDAVAVRGTERLAIEVETMSSGASDAQAIANARKCLDEGFGRVILFAIRHSQRLKRGLAVAGLSENPRLDVWSPATFFRDWWMDAEARHRSSASKRDEAESS